jgi:hypothetical protein
VSPYSIRGRSRCTYLDKIEFKHSEFLFASTRFDLTDVVREGAHDIAVAEVGRDGGLRGDQSGLMVLSATLEDDRLDSHWHAMPPPCSSSCNRLIQGIL